MTEQILYQDTRGTPKQLSFSEALIAGIAPSGGLYVPTRIPQLSLDEISSLAQLPYHKRAARIYRHFATNIDASRIDALMQQVYGSNFYTPAICPITSLTENTHILELWHGPTSAFKDMALQCLPVFFSESARLMREQGKLNENFLILVATSGDTGKAALEGFKNIDGVHVGVFFPAEGVSDLQRKQMLSSSGKNLCVWALHGNFDDCQTGVKHLFADNAFSRTLTQNYGIRLSSANSINWGRLLPQIIYYLSSYAELVKQNKLEAGDELDICVPTGNFGNILAAWYAKRMGAPLGKLMCASNENRVLTDFITTGIYDIAKRPFVSTPSPSMDILVSSNLERQLFELTDRDSQTVCTWMKQLQQKKSFRIDKVSLEKLQESFKADAVDNNTCLQTIRTVFDQYNYLLDPHSAVAWAAAHQLRTTKPVLIVSTAHWAKFGADVYRALHGIAAENPLPSDKAKLTGCQLNTLIAQECNQQTIPHGLAKLDTLPQHFNICVEANDSAMKKAVEEFLSHSLLRKN